MVSERDKRTFKVLKHWSNEECPIYGPERKVVLAIEWVAAPLFGVVTYGVQLIVYHEDADGISIWAARPAPTKWPNLNKLGVTVAGGLRSGKSPLKCVIRASSEKTRLDPELVAKHVRSAGSVKYATVTDSETTSGVEAGLIRAEVQFLY